ncbi:uncharacterized protein SPSK_09431 [Sporothrix schenckii 1099-18]|uniref:Uncharacterized protein n=1 Tax=Sporothrix schenckii 1099-18 TaxID=1397361 RepID=A0A0F2MBX1_SPOSC|nr:uncharacterized protein SPSK_09431 [Sporothrix schenckii 1099-18]KJR85656.1 hypothetical protein SPSK_09431 [Sporothrix schenckii 1099-18]
MAKKKRDAPTANRGPPLGERALLQGRNDAVTELLRHVWPVTASVKLRKEGVCQSYDNSSGAVQEGGVCFFPSFLVGGGCPFSTLLRSAETRGLWGTTGERLPSRHAECRGELGVEQYPGSFPFDDPHSPSAPSPIVKSPKRSLFPKRPVPPCCTPSTASRYRSCTPKTRTAIGATKTDKAVKAVHSLAGECGITYSHLERPVSVGTAPISWRLGMALAETRPSLTVPGRTGTPYFVGARHAKAAGSRLKTQGSRLQLEKRPMASQAPEAQKQMPNDKFFALQSPGAHVGEYGIRSGMHPGILPLQPRSRLGWLAYRPSLPKYMTRAVWSTMRPYSGALHILKRRKFDGMG